MTGNYARQVSLFGNPRINVWLPTPRGLSQAPTSFIGSWCQGIHRAPLSTWRLQLMLASTVQFSRYGRPRDKTRRIHGGQPRPTERQAYARSLRTQQRAKPHHRRRRRSAPRRGRTNRPCRIGSQLASAPRAAIPGHPPGTWPWTRPPEGPRQLLLRKEVIQPHLPVRLPCYDFVPIADPTFDGSLPYGLGHRLRVLPTFVT